MAGHFCSAGSTVVVGANSAGPATDHAGAHLRRICDLRCDFLLHCSGHRPSSSLGETGPAAASPHPSSSVHVSLSLYWRLFGGPRIEGPPVALAAALRGAEGGDRCGARPAFSPP